MIGWEAEDSHFNVRIFYLVAIFEPPLRFETQCRRDWVPMGVRGEVEIMASICDDYFRPSSKGPPSLSQVPVRTGFLRILIPRDLKHYRDPC